MRLKWAVILIKVLCLTVCLCVMQISLLKNTALNAVASNFPTAVKMEVSSLWSVCGP